MPFTAGLDRDGLVGDSAPQLPEYGRLVRRSVAHKSLPLPGGRGPVTEPDASASGKDTLETAGYSRPATTFPFTMVATGSILRMSSSAQVK
jgi:hypothetical protein